MAKENHMQVEEGIAVPGRKYGLYVRNIYPWAQMKPGDSFLIRCATDTRTLQLERNKVSSQARYSGIQITTRAVDDGLRVWMKSNSNSNSNAEAE